MFAYFVASTGSCALQAHSSYAEKSMKGCVRLVQSSEDRRRGFLPLSMTCIDENYVPCGVFQSFLGNYILKR